MGATPFHYSVLEVWLLKHFDKPTDMRYDGTQDPQEHLTVFEARINLEGVGDEVRCRAFPVTLVGPAIRWFNSFPQGFCCQIDGLTDSVASLCLTNGLLNEDFRKHLTTKPVWTMREILSVAREYINDEEVSQVVAANKRQPAYNQPRQHGGGERLKEHTRDGGPSKTSRPFPRVGKFTNYTPLTVPIVEVYQQIAEKEILSKPQPLNDRTGGNKSLYCDYRKGYEHKTQDCFDLKDALEQAIRDGKLAEFSHLIRELRRRDRDREGEDKTRVVKRRQEPEDNEHGLTIVNVVTARDAAPRSKSANKKDAKVLAENPPMVITARVGTGIIKRILIDTGADSNIMFRNVFDALGLRDANLRTHQHGVVGLGDHFIKPDGIISLPVSVGLGRGRRSVMAEFVVLRDSTAYNVILGRKTINDLGAVISTKMLVMKFVADDGSVGSIKGDLEMAVACDNASLSLRIGVAVGRVGAAFETWRRAEGLKPEGVKSDAELSDGEEVSDGEEALMPRVENRDEMTNGLT
ncbi:uncharacterized protein [Arachis hypogaea]|uniref:uncharacterized protein n=1 Tax=Arachis hypogaea TaxID=3818 RepID=UPI003B21653C